MAKNWTSEEWAEITSVLLDCIDLVVEYDPNVGDCFSRLFLTGTMHTLPEDLREEFFPMFRLKLLECGFDANVSEETKRQCASLGQQLKDELTVAEKAALERGPGTTNKKDLN